MLFRFAGYLVLHALLVVDLRAQREESKWSDWDRAMLVQPMRQVGTNKVNLTPLFSYAAASSAIYTRVSTDKQSHDSQLHELRDYC